MNQSPYRPSSSSRECRGKFGIYAPAKHCGQNDKPRETSSIFERAIRQEMRFRGSLLGGSGGLSRLITPVSHIILKHPIII